MDCSSLLAYLCQVLTRWLWSIWSQTWMELHKVPFPQRAPSLQLHLYQHLLPRLIKRACRPVDLDELGASLLLHAHPVTCGLSLL